MTRGYRLVAAIASSVALTTVVAPPAAAQTEPPAAVSIELVDRAPWVAPADEATFLVTTAGELSTASVQVEVFSALDSVEELEQSSTEDVGVRLALSPPVPVDSLPPGPDGTQAVVVRVSSEAVDGQTVQIVEPGVHPVVISLLAEDGTLLDQIRTPLVRLGDEAEQWEAPDLAVLLDVAAPPSLQPDGTRAIQPRELRQLTHVGEVLAAHPDLELSVAALPDTVDALGILPDTSAATLLERLGGRDVLALPYLPLPVDSLIEQGLGGLIAPLVVRGEGVLVDRLAAAPTRRVWGGTTEVGAEGGRLLAELGFDAIVVEPPSPADDEDDEDLPPLPDSGPRPLTGAGPLLGLVAAPVLSAELAQPSAADADAAHVALARLLLRPVEGDPSDDPDEATTVLVRPGDLPADSVLARLLDLLDDPSAPVRVGGLDLVDELVDEDTEPIEPDLAAEPDLAEIAPRVLAAAGQLDAFQVLIGGESARADDLRLQVATALATTTPAPRRDAAMDAVEEVLGTAFGSIRLSGQTDLNLTSRRGTLPVTVENANPFPVDVIVRTRSDRIAFPDGGHLPVTVGAEDILRIDVPVQALATGSVPVFVELWTPDDRIRLDGRQLNVRSTAISGVGLVLSVGALVVLVVWWARSWRRNRRARPAGTHLHPGPTPDPMG